MTKMASDPHVLWLAECTAERVPLVGGKATGLGALLREGLQVPAGFAITTEAYREHVERNGLAAELQRLVADCTTFEAQQRAVRRDPRAVRGESADAVARRSGSRCLRGVVGTWRKAGRGAFERDRRGFRERLVRRPAGDVPLDPRRQRSGAARRALLGEPVHGAGDRLPRADAHPGGGPGHGRRRTADGARRSRWRDVDHRSDHRRSDPGS